MPLAVATRWQKIKKEVEGEGAVAKIFFWELNKERSLERTGFEEFGERREFFDRDIEGKDRRWDIP